MKKITINLTKPNSEEWSHAEKLLVQPKKVNAIIKALRENKEEFFKNHKLELQDRKIINIFIEDEI